ncbi:Armadillo repeat-containing protein 2 [Symbiodinium microadriaticum]|uniref:Armadillo repeat-containing protein 2 n=1 Tax=Symbiodinium microadriaticum TaxID=2951 RepID=A0A1Q9ERK3_SYMMI|nr:Armadillo repeat-containing protein 2 [Symbiodinium microadriaticum]
MAFFWFALASAQDVEEVLVKLVRLLANIAISPDAGATLAASSAVVDPLLDMLGAKKISDSEELVLNVVAAVTNLLFYDVPSNMLFQEESKQLLCRLFRPLLLESYNVEALVETARALGNLSRHADARKCMVSLRLDEILAILLDHDDRDLVKPSKGASESEDERPEREPEQEVGSQPEQRGRGLWLRVAAAAAGVLGGDQAAKAKAAKAKAAPAGGRRRSPSSSSSSSKLQLWDAEARHEGRGHNSALGRGSSHLPLHGAAGTIQLSGEDFNGMGEKFAQAMKQQAGQAMTQTSQTMQSAEQAWGASAQKNKQAAQQTVQSAFQGNLGHLAPHENLHDSNPCADDEISMSYAWEAVNWTPPPFAPNLDAAPVTPDLPPDMRPAQTPDSLTWSAIRARRRAERAAAPFRSCVPPQPLHLIPSAPVDRPGMVTPFDEHGQPCTPVIPATPVFGPGVPRTPLDEMSVDDVLTDILNHVSSSTTTTTLWDGDPNLGGASSSSTTTTSPSCTSSPTPVSSPLSSASSCCTTTTTSPLHEGLCSDVSGIDGLLESTSTSTLVAHLDMEGELDEDVDYEPDEVEVELDEVEEDEETGDVGARASENARDGADDRDDTVPDTDRDTGAGLRPILEDIPELTEREHVLAVHVSRLVVAELYHLLRSTGVVPGPGSTFRVDARITPARKCGSLPSYLNAAGSAGFVDLKWHFDDYHVWLDFIDYFVYLRLVYLQLVYLNLDVVALGCLVYSEQFEGLCYSKCSILTGGMKPVRCAAHICEPLDSSGENKCHLSADAINAILSSPSLMPCQGFDVAGAKEGAKRCPHSPGSCMKDEELYLGTCFKKCSMLTNGVFPHRKAFATCCKATSLFQCLMPGYSKTDEAFTEGGGFGDHDPSTPNKAHAPMQSLTEAGSLVAFLTILAKFDGARDHLADARGRWLENPNQFPGMGGDGFYSCGALVNLAADPECTPRLTGSTPAVEKLGKLLGDAPTDDPLLQLVAVKVLTNLSLDSQATWSATDIEAVRSALLQTIAESKELASISERQQLIELAQQLVSRLPESPDADPGSPDGAAKDWFYCTAPGCGRRFGSQEKLSAHFERRHGERNAGG